MKLLVTIDVSEDDILDHWDNYPGWRELDHVSHLTCFAAAIAREIDCHLDELGFSKPGLYIEEVQDEVS